ncbi:MAG: hypothetical protein IKZ25_01975 [Clostridia bacterium]|nr:hypothetical protein [Clostridia bacterium]
MKKIIASVLCLCCILSLFTGCKGKIEEINYEKVWALNYEKLDGTKTSKLISTTGEEFTYTVEVGTMSGSVDIVMKNDKGEIFFHKKDIPTSYITETIKSPGKFTIEATGKEHVGYISIRWDYK